MKALAPMPIEQNLDIPLDFLDKEEPSLVSGEYETYMRPVEIKRFIHNIRENRQYIYTKDFVF